MVGEGFRPDEPGTAEADWLAHRPFRNAPELDLGGLRRAIAVAAHPDDESLGAGGVLASAARHGLEVVVLVATSGSASHPDSRTIDRDGLAGRRRREGEAAVRRLGGRPVFLDLPDGRLGEHEHELITAVVELVGADGTDTLILAPWRSEPHPDHAAAGRAAHHAAWRTDAALAEFALWAWHACRPADLPWERARGVSLQPRDRAARAAAISTYRSQTEPWSSDPADQPVVTGHLLAHCERVRDVVFEVPPEDVPGTPFDEVHRAAADPWDTAGRYETVKRRATVGLLPVDGPLRIVEVGCSIGRLTVALAEAGHQIVAVDESSVARDRARAELDRAGVADRVTLSEPPPIAPEGRRRAWVDVFARADVVVLSEVGYYLSPRLLHDLVQQARACGCAVLACHWRHPIVGWPLDGDAVHRHIEQVCGRPVRAVVKDDYRLGFWAGDRR